MGVEIPQGDLLPVEQADDALASVRAPGTRYLIEVSTIVGEKVYRYTLELNANRKVIGGEWGRLRTVAELAKGENGDKTDHPDFIWYLDDRGFLGDGLVSPLVLQKLLECSSRERADGDSGVKLGSSESNDMLGYVDCRL